MSQTVYIYDPAINDKQSRVRGVGRYLQLIHENFPEFTYIDNLSSIIHDQSSIFINPFFDFLKPPLTIRRVSTKQVAVIHDLIPLKYPNHFPIGLKGMFNVLLNKSVLKNYDTIITVSETVKKDIVKMLHMDGEKIKVVYHCLPEIFTRSSKFKGQSSKSYCLYVGDATWNKNLVNLAKAIKIINVSCVFAGRVFKPTRLLSDGRYQTEPVKYPHPWQQELKQFFQEAGDDKRFKFLGYVPDTDLIKLYQQASVNILPSLDEGFGFSWLEAASQRCPSVVNNIPVFQEIAQDSAIFCDANNSHDLANTIGKLYFNKNVRNQWGEKAYNRSLEFNVKKWREDFSRALK